MRETGIFVPLHITAIQDIYMANVHSRFFSYCKKYLNVTTIMTIDRDYTNKFDDLYVNTATDHLIDLRDKDSTGIVAPTVCAIDKAADENCSIFVRVTQDTQIVDFGKFISFVQDLCQKERDFICGSKDICRNIKKDLEGVGITQQNSQYAFVQGNMVIASMRLWEKRYKQLPSSVHHHRDDSVFSYLVEHLDNVKPTFINMDFWRENRTRDVYYLESLYNSRKEYAERA